jgi:thioesterase domain-containing protein
MPHQVVEVDASRPVGLLERLNDREAGAILFLVPGAGMQSSGFRTLASLLPVPAFGLSWPKGYRQRSDWPKTLTELAELFLQEIRNVQPSGPYLLAGHSFGATVCLEMAQLLEAIGEQAALVALLDPRSLAPTETDVGGAFAATGLVDSLALLSQTAEDGARYVEQLEEILSTESSVSSPVGRGMDAATRRALAPGMLAALEHVHETSVWYSGLVGTGTAKLDGSPLAGRVAIFSAEETWLSEEKPLTRAEAMVRSFQTSTFQLNTEVALKAKVWSPAASKTRVPGTHFSMLNGPHVAKLALRLCRTLDEVDEALE